MLSDFLTWIDHDSQARERSLRVLALFKERGTRDELGLGSVRDNLAEALFPGTSTIQTRLRYMLFVPWIYQRIETELASGRLKADRIGARAEALEYEIVDWLGESDDQAGVFGRSAGRQLKRLPSSVYWAGLEAWGIRVMPLTRERYHRQLPGVVARRREGAKAGMEGDEVDRDGSLITWHPALPPAPEGFPAGVELSLTPEEAGFLLDRVRQRHPRSLLAHLSEQCRPAECDAPWQHPDRAGFSEQQQELLDHAEKLSLLAQGAFLIYNLALSEKQEADGLVADRQADLEAWGEAVDGAGLAGWDLDRLWALLVDGPYRIPPGAKRFIEQWLRKVVALRGDAKRLQRDRSVRRLIEDRERLLKGPRSRFANPQALEQWGGYSGIARYSYRWPTVRRFHQDLYAALSGSGNG